MTDGPRIWVPRLKILEAHEMAFTTRLAGRFRLTVRRPSGVIRAETGWFSNLILDAGLDRIGAAETTHTGAAVGTGTTAPTVSDTTLENQIASTTTIQSVNGITLSSPPYGLRKTWVYRFGTGVAAGNLTEIGVGWTGSPLSLFARELIRDEEGAPTTLTILADETLDLTYELTVYAPTEDVEGQVTITGSGTHDIVCRAANVTTNGSTGWKNDNSATYSISGGGSSSGAQRCYATQTLGDVTGLPSGTQFSVGSRTNSSYSEGSFQRDFTLHWGLNDGNTGSGIGSVAFRCGRDAGGGSTAGSYMSFQCSYNPVIDKDNTKVLTLPYRHSWARVA